MYVPTTLGRSGTDTTAIVVAASAKSSIQDKHGKLRKDSPFKEVEVLFAKNTDGVLTADPNIDQRARSITELSYILAEEAGNIHKKSIYFAELMNIPIKIFNIYAPDKYTKVNSEAQLDDRLYIMTGYVPSIYLRVRGIDSRTEQYHERLLEVADDMDILDIDLSSLVVGSKKKETKEREQDERRYIKMINEELASKGYNISDVCPTYYFKMVGNQTAKQTEEVAQFLRSQLGSDKLVINPVSKLGGHTLTFATTREIDPVQLYRDVHERFILNPR